MRQLMAIAGHIDALDRSNLQEFRGLNPARQFQQRGYYPILFHPYCRFKILEQVTKVLQKIVGTAKVPPGQYFHGVGCAKISRLEAF